MASLLGNPTAHFGDNLVGHVLPRLLELRHRVGLANTTPAISSVTPMTPPFTPRTLRDDRQVATIVTGALPSRAGTQSSGSTTDAVRSSSKPSNKRKHADSDSKAVRRQHCRANQARYRNRQRDAQLQLEKSVKQLHQEVGSLKRRQRDLSSRERSTQSSWSIVAELFHLLEGSFRSPWHVASFNKMKNHEATRQVLAILERSFAHNAAMGDLQGADALMEQLRSYLQYFGEPRLQLQQIESVAPGVMVTKASLSVTLTEPTFQHLFPHIVKLENEQRHSLHNRLLGKRLQLSCSMRFLFDDESSSVVRLETNIDLVKALHRVLGNLADVAEVLQHALISSESTISCSTQ
jgi:hypothetical protein